MFVFYFYFLYVKVIYLPYMFFVVVKYLAIRSLFTFFSRFCVLMIQEKKSFTGFF